MRVIDADTHIDETEDTWEWLAEAEAALKPKPDAPANPDPTRPPTRYWVIDGHRQPRLHRDDQRTKTTVEARELLDPAVRLRAMDQLATEVQVLYPTTLLVGGPDKPEGTAAVKRSYRR